MKLDINNYPGAKRGSGVYQWIINRIPEFSEYHEIFGGSAFIAEEISNLVPNKMIFIKEIVPEVFHQLDEKFWDVRNVKVDRDDSIAYIKTCNLKAGSFIYADPPYLKNTRRNKKDIYKREWNIDDHKQFLELVKELSKKGVKIMISHYPCRLYNVYLEDWHKSAFDTVTRQGPATENIWMNYDISQLNLATTHYLGEDFTDRQRIKRRKKSFLNKLNKMPKHERQAILDHIKNNLNQY